MKSRQRQGERMRARGRGWCTNSQREPDCRCSARPGSSPHPGLPPHAGEGRKQLYEMGSPRLIRHTALCPSEIRSRSRSALAPQLVLLSFTRLRGKVGMGAHVP